VGGEERTDARLGGATLSQGKEGQRGDPSFLLRDARLEEGKRREGGNACTWVMSALEGMGGKKGERPPILSSFSTQGTQHTKKGRGGGENRACVLSLTGAAEREEKTRRNPPYFLPT